jgi:trans-aconitate methyltransferase
VATLTRDLDAEVLVMKGRIGGRVLELGCGTGKNTLWLAQRAQRLVACDFSPAMLARAKERVPGVEFHLCDIRGEWPVDEVDVVVVDLVLEHVDDLRPVFAQAQNKLESIESRPAASGRAICKRLMSIARNAGITGRL